MKKIGVAILGLGGAGGGAYKILQANGALYQRSQNVDITIESVFEPDCERISSLGVPEEKIALSIAEIISNPDVNVVIEAIEDVPAAREYTLSALNAGKTVVLSNTELVCKYSHELERTAKRTNAGLYFEASCLGGVPIVRTLLDGLRADRITSIMGVVSNTAEDRDGKIAAYKLSILASLAFHTKIPFEKVVREVPAEISAEDVRCGESIGCVAEVVVVGKNTLSGVEVSVHPALVKKSHPLALHGNGGAVYLTSDAVGEVMLYGNAKGSLSAGSAVVSDILYAATHAENRYSTFKNTENADPGVLFSQDFTSAYYLRLTALNKSGILAKIASVLGKCGISVAELNECGAAGDKTTVVLITHETHYSSVMNAVQKLNATEFAEVCSVLRVIS